MKFKIVYIILFNTIPITIGYANNVAFTGIPGDANTGNDDSAQKK